MCVCSLVEYGWLFVKMCVCVCVSFEFGLVVGVHTAYIEHHGHVEHVGVYEWTYSPDSPPPQHTVI